MRIRKSVTGDITEIMMIYEKARQYMRLHGNSEQWKNGYPAISDIENDIRNETSFVVVDENDKLLCVFAFIKGPDITYEKIYNGDWPNDNEYYVIHRIAVSDNRKGVASFVFDECIKIAHTLRIDTHRDNYPMQNALIKNGFKYCGIIHLLSGDERLAYQKEG